MSTPRPTLHIVSNADARFFPGLAVAVASAVAAASGKYNYHFFILDGGIPTESLSQLRTTIASIASKKSIRVTLEPLEIDQGRLMNLPALRGSAMTYAKLLLPEALPHLDSVIYLDADVLCFTGIEAIQTLPDTSQSWLLAGARDHIKIIGRDCPWNQQISKVEQNFPYINAGMMWMNLKQLRKLKPENFGTTSPLSLLDLAAQLLQKTSKIKNFRHDQTLLNFLCRGRIFILPDTLNHRTAIGSSRLLCEGNLDFNLHYIGSPKPWLGDPKTHNWLAHCLWHQARALLFPALPEKICPPPANLSIIRRKSVLYRLLNRQRAAHYRSDLLALSDPGGVIANAKIHWQATING